MNRVILVLCDGLRADTAFEMMGYLEHLTEAGKATRFLMQGELPSVSRPLYETVITGTPVSVHGVTSNWVVRPSNLPNLFSIVRQHGGTTAASAYYWFSELCNGCPFDFSRDREVDQLDRDIQHGRFYVTEDMPDEETFWAAEMLLDRHDPNFLLIHPMGMDRRGHTHGPESNEYRNHAILIDTILATRLPGWVEHGCDVLIGSDHGISSARSHAGNSPDMRRVPLYLIRRDWGGEGKAGLEPTHLELAPTILQLLGLPIPATMKARPLAGPGGVKGNSG